MKRVKLVAPSPAYKPDSGEPLRTALKTLLNREPQKLREAPSEAVSSLKREGYSVHERRHGLAIPFVCIASDPWESSKGGYPVAHPLAEPVSELATGSVDFRCPACGTTFQAIVFMDRK